MSDRSGRFGSPSRPGRRLVASIMTAVLLAGLPASALGADPDPVAERAARMRTIIEKIKPTDHVHEDGSTHEHRGMEALSDEDLRFLGLRRGSGPCSGMYEIVGGAVGHSCTHGFDVIPRPGIDTTDSAAPSKAPSKTAAEPVSPTEAGMALAATCDPVFDPESCPKPPGWKVPTQIPCYSTGPFVEVMYIYWGTGRYTAMKERIRRSIAWADLMYKVSAAAVKNASGTPGNRHARWAMASGCKLKVTPVQLANTVPGDIGSIKSDLVARGKIVSTAKYLGYVDYGDSCTGGIAEIRFSSNPSQTNPNNNGGSFGMLDAGCAGAYDFGSVIAAHELTHTLGAVQTDAPHTTGGHCWDDLGAPGDGADIMCYDDGGVPASKFYERCPITIPETFDCGKDDYYNPYPKSGNYLYNHWNTATNKFLATAEPPAWDTIPILSATLVGNGTKIGGYATIGATVTAPTGLTVDHVRFRIAGEEVGRDDVAPYAFELDTFPIPNLANVKVDAIAYDQYGMPSQTSSATYTVANPQVHLDGPVAYLTTSPKINWAASALATGGRTVSKVEFLVFDQVVATDTTKPYGGPINLAAVTGFTEGVGYLDVAARVTDSAGVVRTTATRPMSIGTPWATVAPLHTYPVKGGVAARLQAAVTPALGVGIAKVEFLVNETLVGTDTSSPYAVDWTPGATATKNLRVRITDKGGYVWNGQSESFDVVTSAASVTISAPTDGALVDGMFTVSGSAAPPPGGTVDALRVYVDGYQYVGDLPVAGGSLQVDGTGLPPGDHFVRVGADGTDSSGSWTLGSVTRRIRVDGPDVTITGPAEGAVVRQAVNVGATVGDLAGADLYSVQFYSGENWVGYDDIAPYTVSWNSLLEPDGLGRLTARVSTSAGDFVSPIRTVTKRNLRAWFTSPLPNAVVSGMVAFKAGGRCDLDCVLENATFRIDGVAVKYDNSVPYAFTWDSTTIADGPHTYSVTFSTSDARATSTIPFPFVVDNTP
jgi:hypothetical protein